MQAHMRSIDAMRSYAAEGAKSAAAARRSAAGGTA
jgi:hypothetical protein